MPFVSVHFLPGEEMNRHTDTIFSDALQALTAATGKTKTPRDGKFPSRGVNPSAGDALVRKARPAQLPPLGRAFLTVVNVALAFCPNAVIVPMQTRMIRANMTAYSTAVGPSSAFRNLTTFLAN